MLFKALQKNFQKLFSDIIYLTINITRLTQNGYNLKLNCIQFFLQNNV